MHAYMYTIFVGIKFCYVFEFGICGDGWRLEGATESAGMNTVDGKRDGKPEKEPTVKTESYTFIAIAENLNK